MYRIILADDEKWSLYGLKCLIDWEKHGFEIVGMASDGLSALEMCRKEKPDLLLSDIRMPGMDGLELTRALAMEIPQITVILITGYNDLSYAQRALRLGVFDFLLKQVTPEDMEAMLRRYLDFICAASTSKEEEHKRSASFYFSFFDESNTRSIRQCCEALCIQAPYGRVQAVTFSYQREVYPPTTQIYQGADGMALAFHTGPCRITCYCFSDGQFPSLDELTQAFSLPQADHTGISIVSDMDSGFFSLYHQSSLAVLSAQFWRQPHRSYISPAPGLEMVEELRRVLVSNDTAQTKNVMDKFLHHAEGLQLDALEILLGRAIALLAAFRIGDYAQAEGLDLYQYASGGGTADELWAELRSRMQVSAPADDSPQHQMQRILDYIDMHFTEDIRISDVAAKFFLNASYLSTLIRKRTGKTYSDIVTEKRINYAKELLRASSDSVLEIAHRAGYHEYSHFNSLFKRLTGMTPAQYRAQA